MLRSSRNIELKPATVYLIPPGFWHAESSDTMLESIWMGVRGDRVPASAWDGPRSTRSPEILQRFEQAWFLAQQRRACVGPELDGLTRAILGRFLRLLEEPHVRGETQLVHEAIRRMYAEFQSPLSLWLQGSELSISEVAAKAGYQDPLYFSRAIRKAFGCSPTQIRLESVSNSDGQCIRKPGQQDLFSSDRE